MQASSSRPTVSPPPPPTKSPVKACAKSGPSKAVGETLAVGNTDLVDLPSTLNSVKTSQDALIVGIQQHEQAPTATHNTATAPLVSRSASTSATVSLPPLKELKTEMDHLKQHVARLAFEADASSIQQLKQEIAQWEEMKTEMDHLKEHVTQLTTEVATLSQFFIDARSKLARRAVPMSSIHRVTGSAASSFPGIGAISWNAFGSTANDLLAEM